MPLSDDLATTWKALHRVTAAAVIALFPFIFIVDKRVHWPVSPVLPGLASLLVAIIFLPIGMMEVLGRAATKREPALRNTKARRLSNISKASLVAASVWFTGWLLGV